MKLTRNLIKKTFLLIYYLICHPVVSWRVFSSRTKKRIIRITAIILIVTISIPASLWYQKYRANVAEAAWWNDLWLYRKAITVSNSSGSELTDFQVKILDNKDLSSDISAGKIQSDLDDLRFTDINGVPVPYWIEDNTAASVDVWIKAPKLPTTGATFYMYYGNTQATVASNGNNVFEFFDDFNDNSIDRDKWNIAGNTWNETGGQLEVLNSGTAGVTFSMATTKSYTVADGVIETKMTPYAVGSSQGKGVLFRYTDANNLYIASTEAWTTGRIDIGRRVSGSWTNLSQVDMTGGVTASVPYKIVTSFSGTSFISTVTNLNTGQSTQTTASDSNHTGTKPVGMDVDRDETNTGAKFDYFFVRKYASADPSAGTPASEEKGTTPVGYWSFDEGMGSTAYDGTSNANNGSITGASWKQQNECLSGKCLGFDGSGDYVDSGTKAFGSTTGSASFWVKKNTGGGTRPTVIGHQNGNNRFYALFDSNVLTLGLADTGNINSGISNLNNDQWYNIVFTYNNGTWASYLNGNYVSTGSYSGSITFKSAVRIGNGDGGMSGATFDFSGSIDEVKIYGYTRTAAQIKNEYSAGTAGMSKNNEGNEASIGGKSAAWLTQGLVGHWKMDEASWNGTSGEVKDASGNGNNGTAVNGATAGAGKFGNGGSFDGTDDYVNVGDPSSGALDPSSALSVSVWIKSQGSTSTYRPHFICKGESGSQGAYCFIIESGTPGYLRLYVDTGSGWSAAVTGTIDFKSSPYLNTWNYVTAVYDGSTAKIYVNGVLNVSANKTGSLRNSTGNLSIGRDPWLSSNQILNGSLDDVRVYNRALSPQEIQQLYNYAPGPVGYWNMDDGSGTTAKDSSGNGNDGSFINSPTWKTGKYGGAVSMPGSGNYIQVPFTNIASNYTIEGWINLNSFPSGTDPNRAGGLMGGNSCSNSGNVEFILGNNATTPQIGLGRCGDFSTLYSSKTLNLNTWAFVTATVDSNKNITYYINGANAGSANGSSYDLSIKTPIILGDNILRNFNGQIDEVRIYNYVRTAKQITEDMNAGHPVGGSPVGSQVAYWKFNEGQGNTAYDYSGKGHNGTLVNSPTWTQSGKIGKGLQLVNTNGQTGQFVEVTDSLATTDANLKTNDAMTFSTWINPNSTQTAGNSPRIFGSGNGGSQHQYIVQLSSLSGGKYKIQYTFHNGTTYYYFATSSYILPADTWSHLAIICKYQTYCKAYINGSLAETTATVYSGDASPANYFGIGGRSGGYDGIQALMDEFKIYNYALSDDDVKIDFNQGKSLVMGGTGTTSDGKTMDFSAARGYCPPGNTEGNCGVGLNPAPVGEWKLYEGTGTSAKDTSGNSNDGTLTNGPTWRTAKENNAVYFDGTSNKYIISNNNINITGDFTATLEAWVKFDDVSTGYHAIADFGTTGTFGGFGIFQGTVSSGSINVGFYGAKNAYTATGAVTTGRWYHIVAVKTPGDYTTTTSLYINGVKQSLSYNSSGTPNATAGKMYIGSDAAGEYSNAMTVYNVQVYDYARTPSQVTWDYNRGGPVGWWRFDEGQGSSAYDYSGNENTGTLTNMDPPNDWVAGKNNGALDFDGSNDYVSASNSSLDINNNFTLSAWVKTSMNCGAGGVVSWGESSAGKRRSLLLWNGGSGSSCYFYFSGYNAAANLSSNTVVNDGTWHHLLATVDSSNNAKVYVDGALKNQGSLTLSSYTYSGTNIGRTQYPEYFSGNIDDVRLYNYVMSAEQVKQVYNNGAVNFR